MGNAASARSMASWDPTQVRFQDPAGERPNAPAAPPRIIAIPIRPSLPPSNRLRKKGKALSRSVWSLNCLGGIRHVIGQFE